MAKRTKSIKEIISGGAKTLADGITTEQINPLFFDSGSLVGQPVPLYRLDMNNYRYYYRYEGEVPIFYTSVTTLIRNTLPTPPSLIKWLVDKRGDGSDEAMERASYGTFLHSQCAELLINGKYNLDGLSEKLTIFLTKEKLPPDRISWTDELKKDMLAFAQFMIDCEVKPLAIEVILYHPTDGYAGALDLVCSMSIEEKGFFGETYLSGANKGQPKETKQKVRVTAIVDIKSGRKGFYESHEIQLSAYREMWQIHFPDNKVDRIFNWSPKEFRTNPSYNLKDQTNSASLSKLPYLVSLAKIEDAKRSNTITVTKGEIDVLKGLDRNISEKTLVELVKESK